MFTLLLFIVASLLPSTKSLASTPDRGANSSLINDNTNTCPTMATAGYRSVHKVLPRTSQHWVGDGFRVRPVFGSLAFSEEISPLLMFDYAEPKEFPARVGAPLGVGQHPHRGFETVTIAFQGEVEHHDSTGKSGVIEKGDVQWMTAGRGILHQEYHSHEFTKTGGTFEMCQLWVNLPKKNKMTKPCYQGIRSEDIGVVELEHGATARVIAGELDEVSGTAKTFSPVQVWDVHLPRLGSEIVLNFPAKHNCIIFCRHGSVEIVGDKKTTSLSLQEVALMGMDGDEKLRIRVQEKNSSVLILGGEPLGEPIAAQGPFVMNTQDELHQAMSDFRMGKIGR